MLRFKCCVVRCVDGEIELNFKAGGRHGRRERMMQSFKDAWRRNVKSRKRPAKERKDVGDVWLREREGRGRREGERNNGI